MVEAQTFMAAANEAEGKGKLFGDLKKEFPELPEEVISEKLKKHPGNLPLCIRELQEESNRFLYGEEEESNRFLYGEEEDLTDSPWPMYPPAPNPTTEALSISIPNSTVHYNPQFASHPPVVRPMTTAHSSNTVTSTVSGGTMDRQPFADYPQVLIQHQYQRLHRLLKELDNEKFKLSTMRETVCTGEQEIVDKKFRVAGNPTIRDVKHIEDENRVLVQDISEMTEEIDKLGEPFDEVEVQQGNLYATSPPTLRRPPPSSGTASPPSPYLTHRSTSCPQTTHQSGRPNSLCSMFSMRTPQLPSPTTEEIEGSRDNSLENNEWVLVRQNTRNPGGSNHGMPEQNWICRQCTFMNHPALNTCEICSWKRS